MAWDLDLALVRCFVTVAEEGGFTAATRRLACTQSAVSMKIKALEDQLGRRLFVRTSRALALTHQGESILDDARRLLALADEMTRRVRAPDIEGQLRLGTVEYLAPRRLPGLLSELRRLHPRLRFTVQLGFSADLLHALDTGALDVVIARADNEDRPGPPILTEELLWVAAREWEPDKASPVPLVLMRAPCAYRSAALGALSRTGQPWYEVLTATGITGVQVAVEAGLGVGVLGASSITPAMHELLDTSRFPKLPDLVLSVFSSPRIDKGVRDAVISLLIEDIHRSREPG